jgi:hypothetical protein
MELPQAKAKSRCAASRAHSELRTESVRVSATESRRSERSRVP